MEKKYTISRSFSYKHNLGNFQNLDLFSSHTEEIDVEEADEIVEEISEKLFLRAKKDVMDKIDLLKKNNGQISVDVEKMVSMIDSMSRVGNIGTTEDFEGLTEDEEKIIQAVKRKNKREDNHIKSI